MTSDLGESDIAEGIVPEKMPEHILPPISSFLPWHRVRKQFIRKLQWNELTRRNVSGRWRPDLQRPSATTDQRSLMHVAHPLRCLVIPGNHLLDVRSMWNEIQSLDCFVRYLGFNEGQGSGEVGTDVYVANNAVTALSGVLPDSQVIRDRFQSIAGNSPAYNHLKRYGPYHVVNLDFCGSMFPNTVSAVQPYYEALNRLLQYQFAAQKTRWLLFITTMVEPGVVDKTLLERLCEPIHKNFLKSDFAGRLETLCPSAVSEEGGQKVIQLDKIDGEDLIRLFGVALGKWLLQLGQSASPTWTVGMRRSFRYSQNKNKGAAMLSLAFELTPNIAPPIDSTGMSGAVAPQKTFLSEVECAIRIADSVAAIGDVDAKLAADSGLRIKLRDEAANLMASAGFDRDAYTKWIDEGEVIAEEG